VVGHGLRTADRHDDRGRNRLSWNHFDFDGELFLLDRRELGQTRFFLTLRLLRFGKFFPLRPFDACLLFPFGDFELLECRDFPAVRFLNRLRNGPFPQGVSQIVENADPFGERDGERLEFRRVLLTRVGPDARVRIEERDGIVQERVDFLHLAFERRQLLLNRIQRFAAFGNRRRHLVVILGEAEQLIAKFLLRVVAGFLSEETGQDLGRISTSSHSRLAAPKAITATAHKLARILYNLLRYGLAYTKRDEQAYTEQVRNRLEKSLHRRAKELGYELVKKPEPATG